MSSVNEGRDAGSGPDFVGPHLQMDKRVRTALSYISLFVGLEVGTPWSLTPRQNYKLATKPTIVPSLPIVLWQAIW